MNETSGVGKYYRNGTSPQEAYICGRIEEQIAYYENKSRYNKRLYFVISITAILANALIPVVSVFLPSGELGVPKFIITCLSACAAVLSSVLVLFNAKDLWTRYRFSASRLTSLLHQFYSRSGVFDSMEDDEAFRLLVKLSEAQMENENKDWESMFDHDAPPAQKP